MKKNLFIFIVACFVFSLPPAAHSQSAQPQPKYLGRITTEAAEAKLKCEITTPTFYWSVAKKRFKFCSDKNTFIEYGAGATESATAAVNLSEFGGTLPLAIAALGANKTILNVSQNTTVSTAVNIPANIVLKQENGAKITKSGAGTIQCFGNCLADSLSDTPFFSGFVVGDITFTGVNYPVRLSTAIFDNANASTRINIADRALLGKPAEIWATAGHIGEEVRINENHLLRLGVGTFTNNYGSAYNPTFILYSNTKVVGAGVGLTNVYETSSTAINSLGVFYSSSVTLTEAANGANVNITVSDMTIVGSTVNHETNQQNSAVSLGNTENGRIERIHFKGVHGFGAYVGGNRGTGNVSKNCFIVHNIFERVGSQNAGAVNSIGTTISGNQFLGGGLVAEGNSHYIDVEPNGGNIVEDIIISDNLLDGRGGSGLRALFGIAINAGGSPSIKNVQVTNNIIKGIELGLDPSFNEGLYLGLRMEGVENALVSGNQFTGMKQPAIYINDSASVHVQNNIITGAGSFNTVSLAAIRTVGLTNSVIKYNTFGVWRTEANGENGTNNGFSKVISEEPFSAFASVSTANNVSTVVVTQGDRHVYQWHVGKVIYLSGTGINSGNYTIATANYNTKTYTLTTASAGNGTGSLLTKFGGNQYVDNLNATYSIQSGSTSNVTDTVSGKAIKPVGIAVNTATVQLANSDSGKNYLAFQSNLTLPPDPQQGVFFTLVAHPLAQPSSFLFPGASAVLDETGEFITSNSSKYRVTNGAVTLSYIGSEWVVTAKHGTSVFVP